MPLRTPNPGQLQVVGPAGITWQEFTWGELLDGLKKDLYLDGSSLDLTALRVTGAAWLAPTLVNAWANVGGAETAGYLKDPLGFVHLKGLVFGGASGTVAFTLPPGHRPGATAQYSAAAGTGIGVVTVAATGTVTISWTAAANMSLSGITFLAEN